MRALVGKLSFLSGLRPPPADEEWTDTPALFFLSTGRTGTTSLTRLFEKSPNVQAVHEPHPQMFAERKKAYLGGDPHASWISDLFRRGRARAIARAARTDKLYAETSAFLSFFTPAIHDLMPNARFVFSHRHPGEFVRSGMRRGWFESHPNDPTRLVPRDGTPEAAAWDGWGRFEKVCWLWSAFNAECLRCYDLLAPARRITLPSQEQWDAPVGSAEKIFRFAGLTPPSADMIQATYELRHNSQIQGDFKRYEEWSPQQRDTLYRIAGPVMEQLGYSIPARL